MRSPLRALVVLSLALSCNPGMATLSLTASPLTLVSDGSISRLEATAVNADGTVGKGTITFSAELGALGATSVPLDEFGRATTTFQCDVGADPGCLDRTLIKARWQSPTGPLVEEVSIRLVTRTPTVVMDAGVQLVTPLQPCISNPPLPGLATCCRNTMISTGGTAYPCPATRVRPGATFEVEFRVDGGVPRMVSLSWEALPTPPTQADCSAMRPRVVASGATISSLAYFYSTKVDASWELKSGITGTGAVTPVSQIGGFEPCTELFSASNVNGTVMTLDNLSFTENGVTWSAGGMAWFFLLNK